MPLYRVNYEEYMHFEEFIEASTPEEAERQFRNSIATLEPVEAEVFTLDVTDIAKEGGRNVDGKKLKTTGFTTAKTK